MSIVSCYTADATYIILNQALKGKIAIPTEQIFAHLIKTELYNNLKKSSIELYPGLYDSVDDKKSILPIPLRFSSASIIQKFVKHEISEAALPLLSRINYLESELKALKHASSYSSFLHSRNTVLKKNSESNEDSVTPINVIFTHSFFYTLFIIFAYYIYTTNLTLTHPHTT